MTPQHNSDLPLQGSLRDLSVPELSRLDLKPVCFAAGQLICGSGETSAPVVFLQKGVASIMACTHDDEEVAACLLGPESIGNVATCLRPTVCDQELVMQVAGWGYVCTAEAAHREFRHGGRFQQLVLDCMCEHVTELARSAACHAAHTVQQRLCSRLLSCVDRTGSEVIPISLAAMSRILRARPAAVAQTYHELFLRGALESSSEGVKITNRRGVEAVACDCGRPNLLWPMTDWRTQCEASDTPTLAKQVASVHECSADSVGRQVERKPNGYIH